MADYRDIAAAGAELAVTVGIIEAAIEQGDTPHVKENFEEKVQETTEYLHTQIHEFMQFGEAYDNGD